MKEGFKSIKDILIEVGEEEGLTITEMQDIWSHQISYIKKLMNAEGVYAILLPYVGTLSLNIKQFKKELKGKAKEFYKLFINKAEDLQKTKEYSEYENSHKRVTGVNRLARYIIANYETGVECTNKIIEHKKCWDIIVRYSNGVYNKKEK